MTTTPHVNKPNLPSNPTISPKITASDPNIDRELIKIIDKLDNFRTYSVRDLVEHTEEFGSYLKNQNLKTNQIRKFLDAVNRLKFQLSQSQNDFDAIKDDLIFLKPKLAYAAAKAKVNQSNPGPVAPFAKVITAAITQVKSSDDFNRLVQFVESIIAYHKAAGGE